MNAVEYAPQGSVVVNACKSANVEPPPVDWIMSEKFDGQRGVWNGLKREMRTREGHIVNIPDDFEKVLPKGIILDGELIAGKRRQNIGIFRRKNPTKEDWLAAGAKFVVFDSIDPIKQFDKRWKDAKKAVSAPREPGLPNWVTLPAQVLCRSPADLDAFFAEVKGNGGEGVVLRAPNSPYVQGRSGLLLKRKVEDVEDMPVVRVIEGKGRREGKIGTIEVTFPRNRTKVKVGVLSGTEHWEKGDIARVRFRGVSVDGVPQHATLVSHKPINKLI